MKVLVVGDVMLDVVVRPEGPLAPTSDTPSRVRIARGGSGANLAVALAGAHEVTYVGAVGPDRAGEMWRDELAARGVRARLQEVEVPTGVVVALVDESGQRAMYTDRGANLHLSRDFVLSVLDEGFEHLHVSGYSVLESATREVAVAALAHTRRHAATTSVDVCSVGPLVTLGAELFADVVRGVDFLFANEEEARALGAGDLDDEFTQLQALAREGMVTRGAAGSLAWSEGAVWIAASEATSVIDTTGAGDAATGAFLSARLRGDPVGSALLAAMASAAEVVGFLGASRS